MWLEDATGLSSRFQGILRRTVAGDGSWGYHGDEQPSPDAWLSRPQSVAVDDLGNAFIADTGNYRVREVAASGIISTVAGGGSGGDGSLAVNAGLTRPVGVAVDGHDNLFNVDGDRIREVTAATGIISTVAGVGYGGAGGDGGLAINAQLNGPLNVAVDAFDNFYIADYSNSVIRKVTAATDVITIVAGNGTAGYSGDGSAVTTAELNYPTEVAADSLGDLYIADCYNPAASVR
jgi:hypothetical protein